MQRKARIIVTAAAAVAVAAGAAALARLRLASPGQIPPERGREVVDMSGRRVRIPPRPTRILSLCTSATDTVIALRGRDCLVAVDEFSRVVPGTERAAVVGRAGAISRERLAALGIDLAFLWWYQDDAAAACDELSIPVVRIRSGRVDELPNVIGLIGDCLGRAEDARRLAGEVRDFLARLPPMPPSDGKRVYVELYGPLKTVGRETYINDLVELAGGCNVAADRQGSLLLSVERLIQADPDVILCAGDATDAAALAARPNMAGLRAVRQGHVFALDRYWLAAGPHLPQSVEKIRALLLSR